MSQNHTLKLLDEELGKLRNLVNRLGATVVAQIDDATRALLDGDRAAAQSAIRRDAESDTLQMEINQNIVGAIARIQPMADDLRRILAAGRIANDLERVGDHAKNIAKRSLQSDEKPMEPYAGVMRRLAASVRPMLNDVLDAYDRDDAVAARRVWLADDKPNELHDDLFYLVLSAMGDGAIKPAPATQWLFAAKSYERMADHATNIAEEVTFIVTGQTVEARPTD